MDFIDVSHLFFRVKFPHDQKNKVTPYKYKRLYKKDHKKTWSV